MLNPTLAAAQRVGARPGRRRHVRRDRHGRGGRACRSPSRQMLEALRMAHDEIRKLVEFQRERRTTRSASPTMSYPSPKVVARHHRRRCTSLSHRASATQRGTPTRRRARPPSTQLQQRDGVGARGALRRTRARTSARPTSPRSRRPSATRSSTRAIRPDGRRTDEIRPIWCEVGVLPRTHGSALFTRGQTQALSVVTIGSRPGSAEDRRSRARGVQALHAPLQLPALLGGRGAAAARPRPSRDRSWRARRARAVHNVHAERGGVPLHDPHRHRDPLEQRLDLDGVGLRHHAWR